MSEKEESKSKGNTMVQQEEGKGNLDSEGKPINVEEEDNGALQHLIFHSFYPLTCMVPLGEDFITINEKVPDFMASKTNDNLLQETIKTFHGIMQEKDDEILNLRRQLKDEDSTLVKMSSVTIQTDLTLNACDEMERKLTELSESLPSKIEQIYQLELERTKLENTIKEIHAENQKYKDNQLEEANVLLSKEIEDLKQSYTELSWKYDDLNDLKVEIELAKMQREEEIAKAYDTLLDKDLEIETLKCQLDKMDKTEVIKNSSEPARRMEDPICFDEIEKMREIHDGQIAELKQQLSETREYQQNLKKCPEIKYQLSELIEMVKENVLESSSNSRIIHSLVEIFPNHADRLGSTDNEALDAMINISQSALTSEDEIRTVFNVLDAIQLNDFGDIDESTFMVSFTNCQNDNRRQQDLSDKKREEVQQHALSLRLTLQLKSFLLKLDTDNLRNEYKKLEMILNLLNRSYKVSHEAILKKISSQELVNEIVSMRGRIFDICMHCFWENVFHQPIDDISTSRQILLTSVDRTVFNDLIFPSFVNEESFKLFLGSMSNVREMLLIGETTKPDIMTNNLQLMKVHGVSLYHDVSNHLLPRFPKEVRYLLMGRTIDDVVCTEQKLLVSVSQTFLSGMQESCAELSSGLLDILLALDFEKDIFSTSGKPSTSDQKVTKLCISSITYKTESSAIKVTVNKNIKDILTNKLIELNNIGKNTKENVSTEFYKRKNETELLLDLIEKKEDLLKTIFKTSCRPSAEKLTLNKGSVYLSCVSKERVGLDFWLKNVLENYYLKLLNQFKDLTIEEINICITRQNIALKLICPSFVPCETEMKKNKIIMIAGLVRCRKKLKNYIDNIFVGTNLKLRNDNQIYQIFKFNAQNKDKLEDVLQRLYDIDCEIYLGDFVQDMEKRNFSSISDNEMFDQILKLRLSIAAYVLLPFETSTINETNKIDHKNQLRTLKEIEAIIFKLEPDIIDVDTIVAEKKILKCIIGKLKKGKKIEVDKLKTCLLALKKVECGVFNTSFDSAKVSSEFDKIHDNNDKKSFVLNEAESLLNVLITNNGTKKIDNKIYQSYLQIEDVLKDIEAKIPANDEKVKKMWPHIVSKKVCDIIQLISQQETDDNDNPGNVRENVVNNLDYIKLWVSDSCDWRKDCFYRLNNLVRKVNTEIKNQPIKVSSTDIFAMSDHFQDEKNAFEKAFNILEDKFNNLVSTNRKDRDKFDDIDFDQKSDEELKSIILVLEKEIAPEKWSKSDETDVKSWLNARDREELISDCVNLVHKSMMMKIDNLLNSTNEKEVTTEKPTRDTQISQFQDDINAKLAKYEELCDTVEKLKMPQTQLKKKAGSTNQLFVSDTYSRRRNESPSSEMQSKARALYSPSVRPSSSQMYLPQHSNDGIDVYFQQRLDELQKIIRSPNHSTMKDREILSRRSVQNGSDVIIDGFELEDERTPRYYSMKLQDIQHERKEDEMSALLHHIEKHRSDLVVENENLQQQLFINKNLQENQNFRLTTLEKTEDVLRRRLASLESNGATENNVSLDSEEVQIIRHERQRLTNTLGNTQRRMDQLNSELVSLSSTNTDLQHENHNLIIKNQYLERSMRKIEELYEDLVQQLTYCKSQTERTMCENQTNVDDRRASPYPAVDSDHKIKMTDKDKIDLVKKLDIMDQQNKLLRKHCEKMNGEVSELTRKLAEAQDKSATYFKQNQQLTDVLDKMNAGKSKTDSESMTKSLRNKDDEIRKLRDKLFQLETRLVSNNETSSVERLKQELISNKDREISKLADQVESLKDRVDETKAQLEVKEYEYRKLQAVNKQLQNKINDDSYFPPPGYKLVKEN